MPSSKNPGGPTAVRVVPISDNSRSRKQWVPPSKSSPVPVDAVAQPTSGLNWAAVVLLGCCLLGAAGVGVGLYLHAHNRAVESTAAQSSEPALVRSQAPDKPLAKHASAPERNRNDRGSGPSRDQIGPEMAPRPRLAAADDTRPAPGGRQPHNDAGPAQHHWADFPDTRAPR
jgi:hypothetical protein